MRAAAPLETHSTSKLIIYCIRTILMLPTFGFKRLFYYGNTTRKNDTRCINRPTLDGFPKMINIYQ